MSISLSPYGASLGKRGRPETTDSNGSGEKAAGRARHERGPMWRLIEERQHPRPSRTSGAYEVKKRN